MIRCFDQMPSAHWTRRPCTTYLNSADHDSAGEFLRQALDGAATTENLGHLRALAEIFYDEGEGDELEFRLGQRIPRGVLQEITASARKRVRRGRVMFGGREVLRRTD